MRLATVNISGTPRVGLIAGDDVRLLPADAGDMVALIAKGRAAIEDLAKGKLETVPFASAALTAPIQRYRRDVLCTGWNYWDHFEETRGKREGQEVDKPKAPTFFTKSPDTVIGPNDDVGIDRHISAKWDYEAELALVIGKRCRSVSKAEAFDCVFGYFLANDVSARDLQRRHGGQWLKGKSIDRTMPIGPYIVTPEELDLPEAQLELVLNGTVLQSAKIKQMAFPIAELIAELSFGMTLEPGDVLITGTPSGVGNAREPQVFLKPGDEMVVRATGLGELRNHVVAVDLHGTTDMPSMSAAT